MLFAQPNSLSILKNSLHSVRQQGLYALLLLIPLLPSLACADPEQDLLQIYGSEEMLSIATGRQQHISSAPSVASVITAKEIADIGATDLDEVLETIPGLHVAVDNIGYGPIYTFRGIYSKANPQVLMLINGIPITNTYQGNRNTIWGGMPVEMISRIEVIRGPGSALYGADAFAGVINIITKNYEDIDNTEIGVRAGSFDTQDLWALSRHEWNGYQMAWGLELHDTDGQKEIIDSDAQSILDSVFATDASLAPTGPNLSRENLDARIDIAKGLWRFRSGLQIRHDFGLGAGVASAVDNSGRYRSERFNMDLTFKDAEFRRDTQLDFELSYFDTTQEIENNLYIFPPGNRLPDPTALTPTLQSFPTGVIGNPEVFERHFKLQPMLTFSHFKHHAVSVGTGFKFDDLYKVRESKNFNPVSNSPLTPDGSLVDVSDTSSAFIPEVNRKNYFLFVQDVWNVAKDWDLTSGLRYDNFSDFGDTVNPRLALVWATRYDLTSKILYGQAFRAPAFADSSLVNNPSALGNPDIKPEKLKSLELAFDYHPTEKLRAGLNLFHYRWEDIISYLPDPGATTVSAQNFGTQTGKGIEIESEWKVNEQFALIGNLAFQHAKNDSTDQDPGNAPGREFYIRTEWKPQSNLRLNLQSNWIQDRARPAGDIRPEIADYNTTDININRTTQDHTWQYGLAVKNIFDADVREPSTFNTTGILNDLPLAGRSLWLELSFFPDANKK